MNFDRFSKNTQISNFMKMCPVGAKLFYEDGQSDRHDEANSHFSQFVNVPKNGSGTGNSRIITQKMSQACAKNVGGGEKEATKPTAVFITLQQQTMSATM